jgi:hypothetical protein
MVKICSPNNSGNCTRVPNGKQFAAMVPLWTCVPLAVIKGDPSVSSGRLVYAVIVYERILRGSRFSAGAMLASSIWDAVNRALCSFTVSIRGPAANAGAAIPPKKSVMPRITPLRRMIFEREWNVGI